MKRKILRTQILRVLGIFLALSAVGSVGADNLSTLEEAFLREHRLFEKVVEGRSQWQSAFCPGAYEYRVLLQTRITDLGISLNDDGSVRIKARLGQPYVGFQGNYQGFYSFCFPVSGWSGLSVEHADIETVIHFSEGPEGRVVLKVEVESIELGHVLTGALTQDLEEKLTVTLNEGLARVWASSLGDWLEARISLLLNKNLPINL